MGGRMSLSWESLQSAEYAAVYYIQPEDGGLVKIGSSSNVRNRLKNIQLVSPVPLTLIAVRFAYSPVSGLNNWQYVQQIERGEHDMWARFRRHGEWFEPAPALMRHIFYQEVVELPLLSLTRDRGSELDQAA